MGCSGDAWVTEIPYAARLKKAKTPMMTAIRPIGLITHSKNFLNMHAPMTGVVREIMHEIILQSAAEISKLEI